MVKVKVKNTSSNELPSYATAASAGMDLRVGNDKPLSLRPFERVLVNTGLFMEIPEGFEGQIRPRSGLAKNKGVTVLNSPGTIDADYRGEIKVLLINLSHEIHSINPGERIAQMIIAPCNRAELIEIEELSETERGAGGYGHSGVK